MLKLSNLLLSAAFAGFIHKEEVSKTLVLLDNWATISSHKNFFDHLSETLNHEVRFSMIDTEWIDYKYFDMWAFDNVILMAPSIKGKFSSTSN